MLFMHETHQVIGRQAPAFEDVFRNEWLGALAETDDARLVWYLNHAMGSGPAYQVVTITAVSDGAAWEALAQRMLGGDLTDLTARLDACRHQVTGKLISPVYWSAIQEIELREIPTDGREHDLSLYMEDTGWPDAPLHDYIELWDHDYWQFMRKAPPEKKLLDIQACFQVAHGSGIRPEAILMQKIMNVSTLGHLLMSVEKYDPSTWPGSYMAKGLELRDQWESKLLRTSSWSPLW
ncbi:MAG TPA: hypothetical protein VHW93_03295 [Acidimicrobiales bacterium]|jgi:hypothetical protein|nr:hypothetical protein [Acidimicrobiales bacterium]